MNIQSSSWSSQGTSTRGIWARERSMTEQASWSRWRPLRSCRSFTCGRRRTLRVIAWMDEESGGAGSADLYQAITPPNSFEPRAAIESDGGAAHPLGFDVKMTRARSRTSCGPFSKSCKVWGQRGDAQQLSTRSGHCCHGGNRRSLHLASCKMDALIFTIITLPPTRSTRLFPANCAKTPPPWQ